MQSPKYPNWQIEKEGNGYLMTRPDWEKSGIRYAVDVMQENGEWTAELLTWQSDCFGRRGWAPACNRCEGAPITVVREAERRANYWLSR